MADLNLVALDVGLQAATEATQTQAIIEIASFVIGDGFGYTIDPATDTGLHGNLLYVGTPTAVTVTEDGAKRFVLNIPPDAGPFNFGEVGILLPDGTMFAKGVFPTLQTKYSALGANLLSTYTFNALLKLKQSTAIFTITGTENSQYILEVEKWSDVYPPILAASPDTPAVLVKELTINNNSSFLHKSNDTKWTIGTTYTRVANGIVANASLSWVEIPKDFIDDQDINPDDLITDVSRKFVIEFADGFFRSVEDVVEEGDNLRFNLNPDPLLSLPQLNAPLILYLDNYFIDIGNGTPPDPGQFDSIVYTFASAGTFTLTVPDLPEGWDTLQLKMSIQGGGAGGGGAAGSGQPNANPCASGGGGGAGQFMTYDVTAPASGEMLTIVVGTGGGGGSATGSEATRAGSGGSGGQSRVVFPSSTTYAASGGTGGTGALNPWGTSYQNAPGGSIGGGNGSSGPGRSSSGASLTYFGGIGGASRYGAGGSTSGGAGVGLGSGGGGGRCVNINADVVQSYPGGAGRNGQIILEFYDPNVVVLNSRYVPLIQWLDGIGQGPVPNAAR